MRKETSIRTATVLALALLAPGPTAHADEWDLGVDTDNGDSTDNAPLHGAEQVHDLAAQGGVADQDFYLPFRVPRQGSIRRAR